MPTPLTIPALPALVTVLALATYQATALVVGKARARHGVRPPSCDGPEPFQRALRVQANTLEQLVFFLPSLWLAALLSDLAVASALGFVWVGARIAYMVGYLQAPEKRGAGFGISFLSGTILLVMAFVGTVRAL